MEILNKHALAAELIHDRASLEEGGEFYDLLLNLFEEYFVRLSPKDYDSGDFRTFVDNFTRKAQVD